MLTRLFCLFATTLLTAKAASAQTCSPTDCTFMGACVPLNGRVCGPLPNGNGWRAVYECEADGNVTEVQACPVCVDGRCIPVE
ncbi:hypothetical protein B0H13DRAFT_2154836 [Mycena leptocephala]|nr:hypothetical protein B0H13DRAFT_2154836 [Mycena leptocephala]